MSKQISILICLHLYLLIPFSFSAIENNFSNCLGTNNDKKCRKMDLNVDVFDYPYHANVDCEVWENLKPYFLPLNHPIHRRLDDRNKLLPKILLNGDGAQPQDFPVFFENWL